MSTIAVVGTGYTPADSVQKLSKPGMDLYHDGFYAVTRNAELKCPDLEINGAEPPRAGFSPAFRARLSPLKNRHSPPIIKERGNVGGGRRRWSGGWS